MRFLFVHNNFPAQFRHIAAHLARDPCNQVVAIGSPTAQEMTGIHLRRYNVDGRGAGQCHPFARSFDVECRRGEQVLYAASSLLAAGFSPDIIVVHSGWGENLPLRAAFPDARIVVYCEFFYRPSGQDVDFDPEFAGLSLDGKTSLAARNANGLLALVDADAGLSPTIWQRSTYPKILQSKIKVIHEGIETDLIRPDCDAILDLPDGTIVRKSDQILTYVARNLEPVRGFHVFMRALPRIMRDCPDAVVLVVGGSDVSYGAPPPKGTTWKETFLAEVASKVDPTRLHFLGRLPHDRFRRLLQISTAHVYLTYPFVLSWSLIEAMSTGCTIIASDTTPVQEVLDENSAWLVPFLDWNGLAHAAVDCLRHRDRYRHLGVEARRIAVRDFDIVTWTVPEIERFLLGLR